MTRSRRPSRAAGVDLDIANLVDWFGTGLWLTALAPYLRRRTGLEAGDVALWLGVFGVAGLAVVIPGSRVAARRGGRRVAIGLHLARAGLFLPLLLVDTTPLLLATAVAVLTLDRTATGVLQVLVGQEVPLDERVKAMARLHAVANVGIALGSATAGLALRDATTGHLTLVLALDAATFVLAAAVLALGGRAHMAAAAEPTVREPTGAAADDSGAPAPTENPGVSQRLAPLVVLGAANAVLALHIPLLNVVLPLLIDDHDGLPLWLIGAAFVANTVLVVGLQVPLGRGIIGIISGYRRLRWASACLVGSTIALGIVASGASPVIAIAVGGVAVVLITLAEIWRGVGAWAVSYAADAASGRDGRAIGAFALGPAAAGLVGPAVAGPLILSGGPTGVILLAVVIAAAGMAFGARSSTVQQAAAV